MEVWDWLNGECLGSLPLDGVELDLVTKMSTSTLC